MSDQKIDAYIVSSFKDDGTKHRYEGGKVIPIDAGSFGNYEACGLVRRATDEEIAATHAENAPPVTTENKTKPGTKAS